MLLAYRLLTADGGATWATPAAGWEPAGSGQHRLELGTEAQRGWPGGEEEAKKEEPTASSKATGESTAPSKPTEKLPWHMWLQWVKGETHLSDRIRTGLCLVGCFVFWRVRTAFPPASPRERGPSWGNLQHTHGREAGRYRRRARPLPRSEGWVFARHVSRDGGSPE